MATIGVCRRCKYECPISIDQLCYVCADELMGINIRPQGHHMAKAELTDYEKIARWMIEDSDEPIGEISYALKKAFPTEEKLKEEYDTVFKYHNLDNQGLRAIK